MDRCPPAPEAADHPIFHRRLFAGARLCDAVRSMDACLLMVTKPHMPQCQAWVNELRAVFGAEEINKSMRDQGYYAKENGHEFGKRFDDSNGVTGDKLVLRLPDSAPVMKKARR